MVGDFWGATEKDRYWNANGVSLIFAETEKGNQFLSTLKDVTLIRCSFAEAVQNNQMVIRSRPKDPRQEEFCKMLSKKGLIFAASHSVPARQKFFWAGKRAIPTGLMPTAKKMYHFIRRR